MRVLSLTILILAMCSTFAGFVPCLGWLNWLAVPLSALAALLGALGLLIDRDPDTDRVRDPNTYVAALIGGVVLAGVGAIRCFLGGGVV